MIDPSMPQVGFAQGIAIGLFDEGCRKVTHEEVREQYRRKGLCSFCGKIPTHSRRMGISGFYFEPLTVEKKVYEGYCLNCHTLEEVLDKPDVKAKLEAKRSKKGGNKMLVRASTEGSATTTTSKPKSIDAIVKQQQREAPFAPISQNSRTLSGNSGTFSGHHARTHSAPDQQQQPPCSARTVQEVAHNMSMEPKVAASGCATLGRLADVSPPESIATAVKAIADAMSAFPDDAEVQKEGCRAFRRLSSVASSNSSMTGEDIQVNLHNCSKIARSGGIVAVLDAMKLQCGMSRQMHREGIRVLRNVLCAQPDCKSIISENNGVEVIVNIMQSNMDASQIQEDACIVLWSISFKDSETQAELLKCAGIPAIIQAMTKHPEAEKIQYHGCGALHTLSNNKALKPVILKNGGFDAAIAALREHGYSFQVTEKALATLANLSVISPGDKTKLCIMDKEEIHTVVNAIQLHDRSEKVMKIGCYFLELTSRSPSNLRILRAHKELRTLLLNAQSNFSASCFNSSAAVLKMMEESSLQEI
mmetsp:Transcript_15936/g.22781  ORF Transcript_15936/g.22781 Transcript_15936/m.22781 type:complete len:532 (-) Transcript_15936:110-1705(-)|eukprot:CAMPEP_0172426354 /NCGR_PEP_ID=MMETSP1064-20121228/36978_1 /TAXON_ID=202472 /ORGANISM="Aulacoseira subarctica , Strain CCAP 1002/5" /LENGTH=531 /DNA_ID=CAMNT_0013169889 /DNA_START=31 /DNA_END=1626 /DNA_ORIENTATION=-